MLSRLAFIALALGLMTGISEAQGIPKMPKKEEIDRKVKEALDRLPETTAEHEDGIVKFKYKAIPMDPKKIAKLAGLANTPGVPKGVNIDGYIKQYGPMIQQKLNEYLANAGTVEVTREFKLRSKKIPVGTHKFGFVFKGDQIVALVIFGDKMPKKVVCKFKTKKVGGVNDLLIKVEKDKKKPERFRILVAFGRFAGKSRSPFKIQKS